MHVSRRFRAPGAQEVWSESAAEHALRCIGAMRANSASVLLTTLPCTVSQIPYTVLLLLFGCMVSFAVQTVEGGLGLLGDSLRGWTQLDPHVLLFIFLPALVFGSASAVDIHVFTRELGQILILAIPGVIVATVLTAAFSLVVFDYGWTWFDALTFGAMLSATDPVAVVALLKEVGASKRLSLLIEGESLFNDGTAIVIFNVFKAAMITQRIEQAAGGEGGEGVDSVAVVVTFLRVAVGGMALGLVVGKLASYVLRRIRNDTLSEITVTLFAAFATFLVAEGTALKVSGVLALVVLGMVVAADHTVISNHEAMHEFWESTSRRRARALSAQSSPLCWPASQSRNISQTRSFSCCQVQ